jgi:Staphylococcal nuclease homologue
MPMKRPLLTIAFAAGLVSVAKAAVNIVDGDTLKIDGVTVRIVDIDAPETWRSRCENELVLGLKAKERLRRLLSTSPVFYEATGTDRYGRTLARVFAGLVNVGETMVKEGLALRYLPGADAKLMRLRVWCGPDAMAPVKTPGSVSGSMPSGAMDHQRSAERCPAPGLTKRQSDPFGPYNRPERVRSRNSPLAN